MCGKPAALLTCLPGRAVDQPDAAQCRAVGAALAQLHLAAARGSTITIDTQGEGADEALQAIQELVADRFGEGE